MEQKRLLGIVRFYNPEKGFGFIDTNGYGIDKPEIESKSTHIELYFGLQDMARGSIIMEGEWVSFVYEKAEDKKRDRARDVKEISFSEDDIELALHYVGQYSIIPSWKGRNRNSARHVIWEIARGDAPSFKKFLAVFRHLAVRGFSEDYQIALGGVLGELTVRSLHSNNTVTSLTISSLEDIINYLGTFGRKVFKDQLLSFYDETLRKNLEDERETLLNVFRDLPIDSLDALFDKNDSGLSPELRILIYRRKNDPLILLEDSMIDYWNALALQYENPFTFLSMLNTPLPKEIGYYIAESEKASDYLKLWGFIKSAIPECFYRIEDRSVCYSYLQNIHWAYLLQFLQHAEIIPDDFLRKTMSIAGWKRITNLTSFSKDDRERCLMGSSLIRFIAIASISYENESSEIVTCGGHFTWDEGWDPHYVQNYYQIIGYNSTIYVDNHSYPICRGFRNDLRERIKQELSSCLEEKTTSVLFAHSVRGKEFLFYLSIKGTSDAEYTLFYSNLSFETKILVRGVDVE